ncbi:hypothetical protein GCM10010297_24720 [Streptomyces malachitofuscus]|nr:hypothetical protein GCM10010297_24720 [Streptomyces malachitofuscus]
MSGGCAPPPVITQLGAVTTPVSWEGRAPAVRAAPGTAVAASGAATAVSSSGRVRPGGQGRFRVDAP